MISATSARITAEINRQTALSRDIAKLQEQVSTTKKLAAPSDDPAGNARVAAIRQSQSNEAAYATNVETASALSARVDGAMSSLSTYLDQARELVVASRSGTYSAGDRKIAASQLRGIAEDVAALATQKESRGAPLFPDGVPLAIPIGDGKTVSPTLSRNAVFDGLGDMLGGAASALETSDDTARATATGTALDAIDAASTKVAELHGEQGVQGARIDAGRDALADHKVVLSDERSGIEGTDVSEAIALVTAKLNTLDAAQAVFAKLNKQSLFDLLG